MKKLLLSVGVIFLIASVLFGICQAQSVEGHGDTHAYEHAIGLRGGFGAGGFGGGVTYKRQLGNEANYGEAILNLGNRLLTLSALYERTQTTNVDGLRWYYGGGPALGVGNEFNIGLVGVVGIEFTFFDIPLNASLDASPVLYLYQSEEGNDQFDWQVGVFSLRYILR